MAIKSLKKVTKVVIKQKEQKELKPAIKTLPPIAEKTSTHSTFYHAFCSPIFRGMASYGIIWPLSSITEGYILEGRTLANADWHKAARFGAFGAFFMAPVFCSWLKFSSRFFPHRTFKTAITRSLVEQVSYSPLALVSFFFGLSLLEGKIIEDCIEEVKDKFWETYKVNAVYWPIVQTVNFYFISPRNRIVFVSLSSYVYTIFLAHMKSKLNNGK